MAEFTMRSTVPANTRVFLNLYRHLLKTDALPG
jgi:hypothetical protein